MRPAPWLGSGPLRVGAGTSLRPRGPSPPPSAPLVPRGSTATPPPTSGEGWFGMVRGAEEGGVRADGAPLSRPLPHKLRGGQVTRATDYRSAIQFSPSPLQFTGEGVGGWGALSDAVRPPSQR